MGIKKSVTFKIVFEKPAATLDCEVEYGTLSSIDYQLGSTEGLVLIEDAKLHLGAFSTMVMVRTNSTVFTFMLRDVSSEYPVFLPYNKVAILPEDDDRSYKEIEQSINSNRPDSGTHVEPEETFESACETNRDMICPTWLGLSRDMRIFRIEHQEMYGYWGYVVPCYHSRPVKSPHQDNKDTYIRFIIGPGESCLDNRQKMTRWLDKGYLPIIHSQQIETDVVYDLTAFATLENGVLTKDAVRGSDWRGAWPNTGGNMLTDQEREDFKDIIDAETTGRDEQVVCCIRVKAVNNGTVPRYAWLKAPQMDFPCDACQSHSPEDSCFQDGLSVLKDKTVYAVSRINGEPCKDLESAFLLKPGESVVIDMLIPHSPVSMQRADELLLLDYESHLDACRKYWMDKLNSVAQIEVPEQAVNERIKAGLLHCDINTLGLEPDGTALATIGWYGPIGSESTPIIQFFDSMGWNKLSERCLQFFLDRQREDGFIQNYCGYQLETGPVLWSMGEHYRYTRDDDWVKKVKDNILRACDYLIKWRERNKTEELRDCGFGLIEGKLADPEDYYHAFALNGLSYIGIQRSAEMLKEIDPENSRRLDREAKEYLEDIRKAFFTSVERSPVIPLADGTWISTSPPWTEYRGPLALYNQGGQWQTHGAFGARDSMLGSLYLIIGEVLDANEPVAEMMLKSHNELFLTKHAALSQPYYVRHDFAHIKRNEVNEFLKIYYNQFTALQDRENYAFWEHYHHASENKTHEEGWFLMQTRWMLWLEDGDTLSLCRAIPRRWLESGKEIILNGVKSYFGAISLKVKSDVDNGSISAEFHCDSAKAPASVEIRLPHPEGQKASACSSGQYDPQLECVRISVVDGKAQTKLTF